MSSCNSDVIFLTVLMVVLLTITLFVGLKTDTNMYPWFQAPAWFMSSAPSIQPWPTHSDITKKAGATPVTGLSLSALFVPVLSHQMRLLAPWETTPSEGPSLATISMWLQLTEGQ